MKKILILITISILIFSGITAQAVEMDFSGRYWITFINRFNDELLNTQHKLTLNSNINIDDDVKFYASLDALNWHNEWFDVANPELNLKLKQAYLQYNNSFWEGGPEVVTTAGTVKANYHELAGYGINSQGISIENFKIGDFKLATIYTFDQWTSGSPEDGDPRVFTQGILAEGNLNSLNSSMSDISLKGVYVSKVTSEYYNPDVHSNPVTSQPVFNEIESDNNLLIEASTNMDQFELSGTYAYDMKQQGLSKDYYNIMMAKLVFPDINGINITASLRDFDPGYDPAYRDNSPNNILDRYKNQRGLKIEADTTVEGYKMAGTYNSYTDKSDQSTVNKIRFELNKDVFQDYKFGLVQELTSIDDADFDPLTTLTMSGLLMDKVTGKAKIIADDNYQDLTGEIEVESKMSIWKFKNIRLFAGANTSKLDDKEIYIYSGLDYNITGGMTFKLRYANPDSNAWNDNMVQMTFVKSF